MFSKKTNGFGKESSLDPAKRASEMKSMTIDTMEKAARIFESVTGSVKKAAEEPLKKVTESTKSLTGSLKPASELKQTGTEAMQAAADAAKTSAQAIKPASRFFKWRSKSGRLRTGSGPDLTKSAPDITKAATAVSKTKSGIPNPSSKRSKPDIRPEHSLSRREAKALKKRARKSRTSLKWRFARKSLMAAGIFLAARAANDFLNTMDLRGKVVLITGGSRGLGLILARKLAGEGARIVICGRSEESLKDASADLAARGIDFMAVPCDITDKHQIKSMIVRVRERMGGVDVVINNAGSVQVGPMETMKEEDYDSALKQYFWGPFHVINEVLPDMIKKKSGRIVNIVSIGGKVSFPHLLPYNTGKFALSGLSEGVASELKKHNIRVTTVYPGLMRTGSSRNIDVKGQHEKEYAWFKITGSLPVMSMDADLAAHKIVDALIKGRRTITLTIPAKLAIAAHGIAPSLTITVFDWVRFLLPGLGDTDDADITRKGYESESAASESFITREADKAAERNLE